MKKILIHITVACLTIMPLFSQAQNVGINDDGSTPAPSAILDVKSNNKGFLAPRMTSVQRNAIDNPEFGLIVFDTDKGAIMFFDGVKWQALSFSNEDNAPAQERNITGLQGVDTPTLMGASVATSGDYAVVGAPVYSSVGNVDSAMGAAYIYQKGAGGWQPVARLVASDSAKGDLFGYQVAMNGDYIAIASPAKTIGGNVRQGKVYVFKRNGSDWQEDFAITNPTGASEDLFGFGIAISASTTGGPTMAIKTGGSANSVKMYQKTGSTWSLLQTLNSTGSSGESSYGKSLSFDGDYLAIGSHSENYNDGSNIYANTGSVYIYVLGGGVWNLQQKITDTVSGAQLGYSVSISGARLAVSAIGKPAQEAINTSSPVFIYRRSGVLWTRADTLFLAQQPPNIGSVTYTYGMQVALSGNNLIVGSFYGQGAFYQASGEGAAYIYQSANATSKFNILKKVQSTYPVAQTGNIFSYSVAISGDNCVIGDPGQTVNHIPNAGSVCFDNVSQ